MLYTNESVLFPLEKLWFVCLIFFPSLGGSDHTYMGMLNASIAPLCPSSDKTDSLAPRENHRRLERPSRLSKPLGHLELPLQY